MAKEYGCRPSDLLFGSAAALVADEAVWNAAIPIQNSLDRAESETVQKAILAKLEIDAEAEENADVQ